MASQERELKELIKAEDQEAQSTTSRPSNDAAQTETQQLSQTQTYHNNLWPSASISGGKSAASTGSKSVASASSKGSSWTSVNSNSASSSSSPDQSQTETQYSTPQSVSPPSTASAGVISVDDNSLDNNEDDPFDNYDPYAKPQVDYRDWWQIWQEITDAQHRKFFQNIDQNIWEWKLKLELSKEVSEGRRERARAQQQQQLYNEVNDSKRQTTDKFAKEKEQLWTLSRWRRKNQEQLVENDYDGLTVNNYSKLDASSKSQISEFEKYFVKQLQPAQKLKTWKDDDCEFNDFKGAGWHFGDDNDVYDPTGEFLERPWAWASSSSSFKKLNRRSKKQSNKNNKAPMGYQGTFLKRQYMRIFGGRKWDLIDFSDSSEGDGDGEWSDDYEFSDSDNDIEWSANQNQHKGFIKRKGFAELPSGGSDWSQSGAENSNIYGARGAGAAGGYSCLPWQWDEFGGFTHQVDYQYNKSRGAGGGGSRNRKRWSWRAANQILGPGGGEYEMKLKGDKSELPLNRGNQIDEQSQTNGKKGKTSNSVKSLNFLSIRCLLSVLVIVGFIQYGWLIKKVIGYSKYKAQVWFRDSKNYLLSSDYQGQSGQGQGKPAAGGEGVQQYFSIFSDSKQTGTSPSQQSQLQTSDGWQKVESNSKAARSKYQYNKNNALDSNPDIIIPSDQNPDVIAAPDVIQDGIEARANNWQQKDTDSKQNTDNIESKHKKFEILAETQALVKNKAQQSLEKPAYKQINDQNQNKIKTKEKDNEWLKVNKWADQDETKEELQSPEQDNDNINVHQPEPDAVEKEEIESEPGQKQDLSLEELQQKIQELMDKSKALGGLKMWMKQSDQIGDVKMMKNGEIVPEKYKWDVDSESDSTSSSNKLNKQLQIDKQEDENDVDQYANLKKHFADAEKASKQQQLNLGEINQDQNGRANANPNTNPNPGLTNANTNTNNNINKDKQNWIDIEKHEQRWHWLQKWKAVEENQQLRALLKFSEEEMLPTVERLIMEAEGSPLHQPSNTNTNTKSQQNQKTHWNSKPQPQPRQLTLAQQKDKILDFQKRIIILQLLHKSSVQSELQYSYSHQLRRCMIKESWQWGFCSWVMEDSYNKEFQPYQTKTRTGDDDINESTKQSDIKQDNIKEGQNQSTTSAQDKADFFAYLADKAEIIDSIDNLSFYPEFWHNMQSPEDKWQLEQFVTTLLKLRNTRLLMVGDSNMQQIYASFECQLDVFQKILDNFVMIEGLKEYEYEQRNPFSDVGIDNEYFGGGKLASLWYDLWYLTGDEFELEEEQQQNGQDVVDKNSYSAWNFVNGEYDLGFRAWQNNQKRNGINANGNGKKSLSLAQSALQKLEDDESFEEQDRTLNGKYGNGRQDQIQQQDNFLKDKILRGYLSDIELDQGVGKSDRGAHQIGSQQLLQQRAFTDIDDDIRYLQRERERERDQLVQLHWQGQQQRQDQRSSNQNLNFVDKYWDNNFPRRQWQPQRSQYENWGQIQDQKKGTQLNRKQFNGEEDNLFQFRNSNTNQRRLLTGNYNLLQAQGKAIQDKNQETETETAEQKQYNKEVQVEAELDNDIIPDSHDQWWGKISNYFSESNNKNNKAAQKQNQSSNSTSNNSTPTPKIQFNSQPPQLPAETAEEEDSILEHTRDLKILKDEMKEFFETQFLLATPKQSSSLLSTISWTLLEGLMGLGLESDDYQEMQEQLIDQQWEKRVVLEDDFQWDDFQTNDYLKAEVAEFENDIWGKDLVTRYPHYSTVGGGKNRRRSFGAKVGEAEQRDRESGQGYKKRQTKRQQLTKFQYRLEELLRLQYFQQLFYHLNIAADFRYMCMFPPETTKTTALFELENFLLDDILDGSQDPELECNFHQMYHAVFFSLGTWHSWFPEDDKSTTSINKNKDKQYLKEKTFQQDFSQDIQIEDEVLDLDDELEIKFLKDDIQMWKRELIGRETDTIISAQNQQQQNQKPHQVELQNSQCPHYDDLLDQLELIPWNEQYRKCRLARKSPPGCRERLLGKWAYQKGLENFRTIIQSEVFEAHKKDLVAYAESWQLWSQTDKLDLESTPEYQETERMLKKSQESLKTLSQAISEQHLKLKHIAEQVEIYEENQQFNNWEKLDAQRAQLKQAAQFLSQDIQEQLNQQYKSSSPKYRRLEEQAIYDLQALTSQFNEAKDIHENLKQVKELIVIKSQAWQQSANWNSVLSSSIVPKVHLPSVVVGIPTLRVELVGNDFNFNWLKNAVRDETEAEQVEAVGLLEYAEAGGSAKIQQNGNIRKGIRIESDVKEKEAHTNGWWELKWVAWAWSSLYQGQQSQQLQKQQRSLLFGGNESGGQTQSNASELSQKGNKVNFIPPDEILAPDWSTSSSQIWEAKTTADEKEKKKIGEKLVKDEKTLIATLAKAEEAILARSINQTSQAITKSITQNQTQTQAQGTPGIAKKAFSKIVDSVKFLTGSSSSSPATESASSSKNKQNQNLNELLQQKLYLEQIQLEQVQNEFQKFWKYHEQQLNEWKSNPTIAISKEDRVRLDMGVCDDFLRDIQGGLLGQVKHIGSNGRIDPGGGRWDWINDQLRAYLKMKDVDMGGNGKSQFSSGKTQMQLQKQQLQSGFGSERRKENNALSNLFKASGLDLQSISKKFQKETEAVYKVKDKQIQNSQKKTKNLPMRFEDLPMHQNFSTFFYKLADLCHLHQFENKQTPSQSITKPLNVLQNWLHSHKHNHKSSVNVNENDPVRALALQAMHNITAQSLKTELMIQHNMNQMLEKVLYWGLQEETDLEDREIFGEDKQKQQQNVLNLQRSLYKRVYREKLDPQFQKRQKLAKKDWFFKRLKEKVKKGVKTKTTESKSKSKPSLDEDEQNTKVQNQNKHHGNLLQKKITSKSKQNAKPKSSKLSKATYKYKTTFKGHNPILVPGFIGIKSWEADEKEWEKLADKEEGQIFNIGDCDHHAHGHGHSHSQSSDGGHTHGGDNHNDNDGKQNQKQGSAAAGSHSGTGSGASGTIQEVTIDQCRVAERYSQKYLVEALEKVARRVV